MTPIGRFRRAPSTDFRPALLVWCLLAGGCHYDLDQLRRPSAGTDAGRDVSPGMDVARDAPTGTDVGTEAMVATDAGTDVPTVTDVPRDAPSRAPLMGTCTSHTFTDLASVPRYGDTVVVDGSTAAGDTTSLFPVTFGAGCAAGSYAMDGPERVYRYTVRTGPRLVASTNGAGCTDFNTMLFALRGCDEAVSMAMLACDDDDQVLGCDGCGDAGTGCLPTDSTLALDGLVPGDVVYLVVAGINGTYGHYRLSIAENAGDPVAPPAETAGDHCGCAPLPPPDAGVSPPPPGFPDERVDTGTLLGATPGQVTGARSVPLSLVEGIAAQFRLRAQGVAPMGCGDARTVVDVQVRGRTVTSFALPRSVEPGTMVNVMYTPFASQGITAVRTMVPLGYRVRSFDPALCTGGYDIDTSTTAGNTVTLWGQ